MFGLIKLIQSLVGALHSGGVGTALEIGCEGGGVFLSGKASVGESNRMLAASGSAERSSRTTESRSIPALSAEPK